MNSFSLRRTGLAIALACAALSIAAPARADLEKIRQTGTLKVAVYDGFAPFSANSAGIDVDLAAALAKM